MEPIIGRYEREEITPSIEVAAKIAGVLNVTVDYLIGHSDVMVMDKNLVRRMEDIEALPTDDPQVRQPDITLARELLGWEPQVDLREGLQRTIDLSGPDHLIGSPR